MPFHANDDDIRGRAAIAVPAVLMIYCADVRGTAASLDLLPGRAGADVTLLRPFDPVVWAGVVIDGELPYVAPSRVALDCLAGNGRMPAEGEAVLSWLKVDLAGTFARCD